MGNVIAVCISEKKGVQKKNVGSARFIEGWGIVNVAHAGAWHRQGEALVQDQEGNGMGHNLVNEKDTSLEAKETCGFA